ncbi:MAG: serine/threonine protein phosphatase 1 [Alphaproteobacteria bacterium]|nr:serine/threonine protein phosphatase 1 [Alphaproteobacteria bacterium]
MPRTLTYAVGDIHGSFTKLESLLRHCKQYCGADASRLIFLGDYVDRGPRSRDVVNLLIETQSKAPDQVVCLRGNHEEMLIDASKRRNEMMWLQNGGHETLDSYGASHADAIAAEHLTWFKNLPLAISDGKRFFVHAGIEPGVPLDQQQKDVILWIREPFLSDPRNHGQYIVHGHTPIAAGMPEHLPNRLNLDTGACFGGPLTAAVFDDEAVGPIAFITDRGKMTPVPMLGALAQA